MLLLAANPPTPALPMSCSTQDELSVAKHDGMLTPTVATKVQGGEPAPTDVSDCAPPHRVLAANPALKGEEPNGSGPSSPRHLGLNEAATPEWWRKQLMPRVHVPWMK